MTAFDHRSAGTPSHRWTPALDTLPRLPHPRAGDRLVVVAAHPDDETLGAGGLIATAAAAGAAVTVLVATDGEASHPDSPTHSRAALARIRRGEVHAALGELSRDVDVRFAGLPDGALAERLGALAAEITAVGAGCTHLVTPWEGDGHPDHQACAVAALLAELPPTIARWQYLIWLWHWGDPEHELPAATGVIALSDAALAAKRRAVEAYRSQVEPLSDSVGDEPVVGSAFREHFDRSVEPFVVARGAVDTPPEFFAALYAGGDPWQLDERYYERRKRAVLMAALPRPRFRRVFEPGCATGALTSLLAGVADELVAWEAVPAVAAETRRRLAEYANVAVRDGTIPGDWPDGTFDLVVISEIGYYLADPAALRRRIDASLTPDAIVVACHWRHPAAMNARAAEEVHDALGAGRPVVAAHVEPDFLLHVWSVGEPSVATRTGVLG